MSCLISVILSYLIKTKSQVYFRIKTDDLRKGEQCNNQFYSHPPPKLYLIGKFIRYFFLIMKNIIFNIRDEGVPVFLKSFM